MECANCGFENMPGQPFCLRCHSPLDLSRVDVRPPRARWGRSRGIRGKIATTGWWGRRIATRFSLPRLLPPTASLLVPGQPQIQEGRTDLGRWLFRVWVACLALTLLLAGYPVAQWTFDTAVAVHAASVSLWLGPRLGSRRPMRRVVAGLLLFAALRFGPYRGIEYASTGLVGVMHITHTGATAGFLRDGDRLLYRGRWLRDGPVARGDLVVARIRERRGRGYRVLEGWHVNRVSGTAGDWVELSDGEVRVNGEPLPEEIRPLGDLSALPDVAFRVPDQSVVVFPAFSTLTEPELRAGPTMVREAATVARKDVGKVLLRIRGLTLARNEAP